jgi:eukaryotic-like serine/threonine-protein kinase
MALSPGTRLGPYEVQSAVGEGGMGEVYRAHDSRLDRLVAIKILPAEYAPDSERVRRFEQEARASAALNHPNILAVYDISSRQDAFYIVFETVANKIRKSGSNPRATSPLLFRASLRAQANHVP